MKSLIHGHTRKLLALCLFLFVAAIPVCAQDEPVPPAQTPASDERPSGKPESRQEDVPQAQSENDLSNPSFQKPVTNLATGTVLSSTRSPFRWGNLSVMSVDVLHVYDSNYLFLKDNRLSLNTAAVRGLLVYAIKTGRSNFSVQYRPQFWASGTDTQFDYASHMVDLHTFRYLTPRWAINISDRFTSVTDQGRFDQIGFSADYTSSSSNQNPFLSTGRRLMTNSFGLSVDHNLSARDRIEFLAQHQYFHVSEPGSNTAVQDPTAALTEQQNIGGEFGWVHTWRRDNEFGIKYAYSREFFQGFDSSTDLHGILIGISRRLRPSLLLRVSGGPTFLIPAKTTPTTVAPETTATYQASAALFKAFGRSGLTLSYTRNNNFTGQIGTNLNDRYDVSYSQHWSRRIDTVVGGAYIRQALTAQHLFGKLGWTEVDYRLSRSWSFYAAYSYLTQTGPVPFGSRQLVTSGIRWSWDRERDLP